MEWNFFKKKYQGDLEKAEELGLITKEEKLRLKVERAEKELKSYTEKKPKLSRRK